MNAVDSEPHIPLLQTAPNLSDSVPPRKPPVLTAVASGEEPKPDPRHSVLKVAPQFETRVVERSSNRVGAERQETRLEMLRRLAGEFASEVFRVATGIEV